MDQDVLDHAAKPVATVLQRSQCLRRGGEGQLALLEIPLDEDTQLRCPWDKPRQEHIHAFRSVLDEGAR